MRKRKQEKRRHHQRMFPNRTIRIKIPDQDRGFLREIAALSTGFGTIGLERHYSQFRKDIKKSYLKNIDDYVKKTPKMSVSRMKALKYGQMEFKFPGQQDAVKQLSLFKREQINARKIKSKLHKKALNKFSKDTKFRSFRQVVDDSFWLRPKYHKDLNKYPDLLKKNRSSFKKLARKRLKKAYPFAALALLSFPVAGYLQARKAKKRKFRKELIIQGKRAVLPVTAGAVGYGLSRATDSKRYRKGYQKDLARAVRRHPQFRKKHGKYSAKYNVGQKWWTGTL